MNNLFSGSWQRNAVEPTFAGGGGGGDGDGDIEMNRHPSFGGSPLGGSSASGANLDRFFEDVEGIKDELKEVERLHRSLHDSNEAGKTLHAASAVRSLRSQMDSEVSLALKKAKLIKLRLESLDRANAANRSVAGCGPGTSTDRTRTSVVAGLRKKLKDQMESFSQLRKDIGSDYREAVARRYYTVTGEKADEETVEQLVETGEGERFLQRAIEEQGRGKVVDVIAEIQERHGAARELERGLLDLQQVFMDMAVLVSAQGEQLDDIEMQVGKAKSFVQRGAEQLQVARSTQKNTRKWTCIAIAILVVVLLVVLIPILTKK
ncbi:putative syntaxin-121 [Iris pallida]|uniref:Syntaxin-121 n=1 Tax=Iris pallida TaxID=29817 RepID=A0AAX6GMJ2_IRIPA|nr:putative syntaxin-121 [Iris pallida]